MELINRLAKGLVGIVFGALTFVSLMIPIDNLVFGLDPREDLSGALILLTAIIVGGVAGWVLCSKTIWSRILATLFVLTILLGILKKLYPQAYSFESYTFTVEVDGVSFDATIVRAKYADNWLDIDAIQRGGMRQINFHINTSGTGTIALNSDNQFGSGAAYGFGRTAATRFTFATNSSHTGTVEISTLDLVGKKVSGSFDCRMEQWTRGGSGVIHVKGSFEDVPIK